MQTPDHSSIPDTDNGPHHLVRLYLDYLLHKEADTAITFLLGKVQDGLHLKDLYLQVLQPAQYELGRLWQIGQITIAEEHYCTAATQQVMSRLYPLLFATPKNGKVLVAACSTGELHEIGLQMVADLFELDGWDTHFFTAATPHNTILQAIADNRADLLALSATMTSHVYHIQHLIAAVHAANLPTPVQIMVGGNPFNTEPELWRRIGADGTARGAEEAVWEGNRLCQQE